MLVVSILFLFASAADEAVSLRWRLAPGDTFYCTCRTRQNHSIEFQGKKGESLLQVTLTLRYRVKSVEEAATTLECTYLGAAVESEVPDVDELDQAIRGATIEVVLDRDQAVKDVRGGDAILKRFRSFDRPQREIAGAVFGESGLRETVCRPFDIVPREPLRLGGLATRKTEGTIGGLLCHGKTESRLESTRAGIATVSLRSALTIEADKGPGGLAGLGAKVDLKSEKSTGDFQFDIMRGRLRNYTHEARLAGTIASERDSKPVVVSIRIDQKQTIALSEKNPLRD